MTAYRKEKVGVIQASTLREMVNTVNEANAQSASKILKEDIVTLAKENDIWILVYYM